MILDARVRQAIQQGFLDWGYHVDLSSVRESEWGRDFSWVWRQNVHWGTAARSMWAKAQDYNGGLPLPAGIWSGMCHEMAHIWQEQHYGWARYNWMVVTGLLRGVPWLWEHSNIPMEAEADKIAATTWRASLNHWLKAKP